MKINLKSYPALFVAVGIAIVIAVVLIASKPTIQHVSAVMPSKTVHIITAENIPFRTRVTAYGNVEPAITLNSMAQVSGKIRYIHPDLKAGKTIPAGTIVVNIDAEDYTVSLKQTEADLKASQSSLAELEEGQKTNVRSLQLAKQNLDVGEAEYERLKNVYKQRLIAKSTLDTEEQKVIQLRQQVEELQGKINSYDSRKTSVEAQISRAEQEVQNRETILSRTEISLPFDARIGAVNIDKNEFVAVGSVMFEAIDLKGVEINAQLSISSMNKLVSHLKKPPAGSEHVLKVGGRINDTLGLDAYVRLVNGMSGAVWNAKVLRLSDSIDETRQTVGLVVGVDNPYEKVIPGKRPPLLKGMFTAVDVFAPSHLAMVIPRKAVHEGRIYIAKSDGTLSIRDVDIKFFQGDLAIIANGVEAGDQIIITDLIPVIEGMPLEIIKAKAFSVQMKQSSAGEVTEMQQ